MGFFGLFFEPPPTSLTYVRAGGKSSQSSQVYSHIWFNSVIVVVESVCKTSGGHGFVLKLFIILEAVFFFAY